MRTSVIVGLLVMVCLLTVVGTAVADSRVVYNDGSVSEAYFLGSGLSAFVFYDNLSSGDGDIFIHLINNSSNFLTGFGVFGVPGVAFWFDFRGSSGSCFVYDIFSCPSSFIFFNSSFGGQQCNLSGTFRGSVCF
jgi:hypothetical protein